MAFSRYYWHRYDYERINYIIYNYVVYKLRCLSSDAICCYCRSLVPGFSYFSCLFLFTFFCSLHPHPTQFWKLYIVAQQCLKVAFLQLHSNRARQHSSMLQWCSGKPWLSSALTWASVSHAQCRDAQSLMGNAQTRVKSILASRCSSALSALVWPRDE